MESFEVLRERLLAHWIRWMPIQPDYITYAIRRYFEQCPQDRPLMKPQLDAAWQKMQAVKQQ